MGAWMHGCMAIWTHGYIGGFYFVCVMDSESDVLLLLNRTVLGVTVVSTPLTWPSREGIRKVTPKTVPLSASELAVVTYKVETATWL